MERRSALMWLVCVVVALPIVITLLLATGQLLSALGDAVGAIFFARAALGAGLLWLVGLIGLTIVLGVKALMDVPSRSEEGLEQQFPRE